MSRMTQTRMMHLLLISAFQMATKLQLPQKLVMYNWVPLLW